MNLKRVSTLALIASLPVVLGVSSGEPADLQYRLSQASQPHVETVTGWMVTNTVSKLTSGAVARASPELVRERFEVLDQLARSGGMSGPARTASPDPDLMGARSQLAASALPAERAIEEETVDAALRAGLGWDIAGRTVMFPPAYFRFTDLPKLLVISPRDRIVRQATVLLDPNLSVTEAESLEAATGGAARSALVTAIGGLAVYPSMVPNSADPRWTFRTVAHEWAHQYLAFSSLGWRYALGGEDDSRMISVNETVAEVVGRELGDEVYSAFYAVAPGRSEPIRAGDSDFRLEMRDIRNTVDEMLARGKIDEAERFMETSRVKLEEKGYYIRKLNQAYFAFYGTYADDPSAGGRGGQEISTRVRQLRAEAPTLGDFVRKISAASSYEEFLRLSE